MGRKTAASLAKGKRKRLQRKEEQHRLLQAKAAVTEANNLEDPLAPFPVFRNYKNNGIEAELYIKRSTSLDDSTIQWAFNLTKTNLKLKYEQSSWGWSDEKKMEELSDEKAWYLITKSVDGNLLGFSHFRFDIDEGLEVLYCYELQLEPAVHRKGLGKFMMQILELIAFKNNMRKVVLTILKNNPCSVFFKVMNYELDESSPQDDEEETYPFEILSKVNKRLAPTTSSLDNGKKLADHCCCNHFDHEH